MVSHYHCNNYGAFYNYENYHKDFDESWKDGALPSIFTVATFEAAISAVFVILAAVLVNKTLCKSMKAKGLNRASSAGILTLTTVLLLYIVFKQFFSVNLAPGILDI